MTPQQVKEKLKQQGYTYRKFARTYGYHERNVISAVQRWSGRTHGFPGNNAYKICAALSRILGEPISPVLQLDNLEKSQS